MKKKFSRLFSAVAIVLSMAMLSGCQSKAGVLNSFSFTDNVPEKISNYSENKPLSYADGFTSDIAVVPSDMKDSEGSEKLHSQSAILVDITDNTVVFQKDCHKKEYPASTTKILTTILALKYGDKTASRVVGDEIIFHEDNVIICDYRQGDLVPFDVAMHGALLKSGNDAAAVLALFAAENLDDFANLMNSEAKKLGATESHFMNPHGLFEEEHYTTAYDMYLILNEAAKYPELLKVISTLSYTGSWNRTTAWGDYTISDTYNNTNGYLIGQRPTPSYINVIGGKAGYTEKARYSYVMLAEANGHRYAIVVMESNSVEERYEDLDYLLSLIPAAN